LQLSLLLFYSAAQPCLPAEIWSTIVYVELRVMKAILWLGLVGVATAGAFAQGARQMGQGNLGQGNRPPHPAPMAPGFFGRPHPPHRFGPIFPLGFGGYGFGGYGFGGYDYGQGPSVVVVEPPPPAYVPVPERLPETATLVIHEYQPLPAAAAQASEADQPQFAIVLKNTTILSASAVIVQDGVLHIVDPDGGHQRVSLEAVDREATKRVNRERKLQLQLPPASR
jgi:hypothetical protein